MVLKNKKSQYSLSWKENNSAILNINWNLLLNLEPIESLLKFAWTVRCLNIAGCSIVAFVLWSQNINLFVHIKQIHRFSFLIISMASDGCKIIVFSSKTNLGKGKIKHCKETQIWSCKK